MERGIRRLAMVFVLMVILGGASLPALAAPGAAPERQGTTIHIVQWGETLYIIAGWYGVTVNAIVSANGLYNPNYIYAGQMLVIPTGSPAPPPSGPTTTYVVQRGDTLGVIAARHGTTVNELARLNSLMNPNLIYVGQVLKVPGPGTSPTPPSNVCIYWVKAGDTLTRIALQYGTTIWALAIANNLANPSFIWVGQELIIPGCGTTPAPTPTATCPPLATATPRPPTATPTQAGPTPTATPRPPTPTSTVPAGTYQFQMVQEPTKDPCHPGFCVPEVSGVVQDAAGNPLSNSTPVWIKLVSEKQGTMYCRTGEPSLYLQEGLFKFISKDGDVFGEYTLTVIRSQGDPTALSLTYWLKMNSYVNAGQQSNMILRRNY
ncbi:MAG TPA: LysM peptidoglycan-binding domain-containing protein [Anaerolineae bacterium]|nr:LysM peptidoglycan-binding domain-containing protein [Anaerolineae bacterium]